MTKSTTGTPETKRGTRPRSNSLISEKSKTSADKPKPSLPKAAPPSKKKATGAMDDLLSEVAELSRVLDVTTDPPAASLADKPREDLDTCPCKLSSITSWKIDCSNCHQFWHADCLGMKGISEPSINKMVEYRCPYCYVAPVPTINPLRETCFVCRNTETLQNLNNTYEVDKVAQKLGSIKSLDVLLKRLDFDQLTENIKKLENFDLHLQHLLVNSNKWEAYQDAVGMIAADVRDLKERPAAAVATRTSSSSDVTELTKKIQDLSDQVEGFTLLQAQTVRDKNSTSIKDLEKICSTISKEVEKLATGTDDMGSKLKDLQSSVDTRSRTPSASPHPVPQEVHEREHMPPIEHGISPTTKHVEDFISAFLQFLQSHEKDFLVENGRTVLGFGEPYHYPGSKANKTKTDFPPIIQHLVDRINTQFNPPENPLDDFGKPGPTTPGPEVNQCLINKYTGLAGIPEHSDDEPMIDPASSIFTISLGATCQLIFRDKSSGETTSHLCQPGSLYSMSRVSQEFYTHKIPIRDMGDAVRYSLTFRRSHWTYRNALLLVGDSNTRKLKFGEGLDTLGYTTPGKRTFAPRIEKINPIDCCAYPNIAILCGINSIKAKDIGPREVEQWYSEYKHKVEQIRSLNKRCNIYIYPILPTRSDALNKKALHFNELIFNDLYRSQSCCVVPVHGMDSLLDRRTQRLSGRLSFDGDNLHINHAGVRILAQSIKRVMYVTKLARQSNIVHTAKPFSAAVMERARGQTDPG